MSERAAKAELAEFDALPIEVRPLALSAGELLKLAQDWRVSAFDAFYLSLAFDLSVPLAARDSNMKAVAGKISVAPFQP